jgi:hypothetical protein
VLIAAAVCPHPPVLIPAAMGAAGDGPELADLRAACAAAVLGLVRARPELIVIVGSGPAGRTYPWPSAGSLHRYGVPWSTGPGRPVLPLSLTVGTWLLTGALAAPGIPEPAVTSAPESTGSASGADATGGADGLDVVGDADGVEAGRAGGGAAGAHSAGVPSAGAASAGAASAGVPSAGVPSAGVLLRTVASTASPETCRRLGARLAGLAPRMAMLVMGDASAKKAIGVPGTPDPEAEEYDAGIAAALAAADAAALARLDPGRAVQLRVAGRAPWQVLAGATAGAAGQQGGLRGLLRCQTAPYDVSYLVASWAAGPDAAAVLAG